MSASAIYEGTVRHRRFAERSHEFSYRLALAYVDLEELPSLALLRGRLVRFERSDYLGDPRTPSTRRRAPRRRGATVRSAARTRARTTAAPTGAGASTRTAW